MISACLNPHHQRMVMVVGLTTSRIRCGPIAYYCVVISNCKLLRLCTTHYCCYHPHHHRHHRRHHRHHHRRHRPTTSINSTTLSRCVSVVVSSPSLPPLSPLSTSLLTHSLIH